MYNVEIIRLQNQINKLRQIYENRKKDREALVEKINKLDKKIEKIEKIKDIEKTNEMKKKKNQKIKKELKKMWSKIGIIAIVIILIIYMIFGGFSKIFSHLLFTLGINIIGYKITYNKFKVKCSENKKKMNLEKLEKEYQITKEQRIMFGQLYKNVREREVSAYNVYKTIEKIAIDKIKHLSSTQASNQNTLNNIELTDIYHKITSSWNNSFEDSDIAKKVLDNQLKRYLIEKIIKINSNNTLSGYLENLTTEELVAILGTCIPKCYHKKTLSHIIHAILGYASNMQSHSIVWYEENKPSLIEEPLITFDKFNRWNELITNKDTDYVTTFNKVYTTFLNEFMLKEYIKKRDKNPSK